MKPLTDALHGPPCLPLVWTPECELDFAAARMSLSARLELFHLDPSAKLSVAVNASSTHVGTVLQQTGNTRLTQPLSFFLRKLSSVQSKYSAFNRELLAAFSAFRHWHHLLEGCHFKLFTDHKPLPVAIKRSLQPWSAALAVSPDCAGVDFKWMAELQKKCPEVAQLASSLSLHVTEVAVGGKCLLCDVSTGLPRPLVPVAMCQMVFSVLHNLSHLGRRASARLVSSRFVW